MATKIEIDGSILKVSAENGERLDESIIVNLIGNSYIYCKVGPIWLVRAGEDSVPYDDENYNITASEFFIDDIFGTALVLSNYEAPIDWLSDIDNEHLDRDSSLGKNSEEIDQCFMEALLKKSNKLGAYTFLEEDVNTGTFDFSKVSEEADLTEFEKVLYNNDIAEIAISEYFYNPNNSNFTTNKNNKKFRDFLTTSYESVVDSIKEQDTNMVLFVDALQIVKVIKKEDKIKTVDQIIELLIEDDEFEKCATLRDLIKIIK